MRYYSYSEYLKNKFGQKLYKLSLSIAKTCPNRDGTCGRGGCIFCSAQGSGDFAASIEKSLSQQIEDAKKRVENKYKGSKYVAYFQSFTSTHIPPKTLREHLLYVANLPEIAAISVATRADCLGDEILEVLSEVTQIKPLTVELGLQTMHDKTAELINRCCPLSEYEKAVDNLKKIGAEVVIHVILGLPFETPEMMLETVRYVSDLKADGIKLQLLHVIRGTRLCDMYENGEFEVLSKEKYFEILGMCISILPPQMVIHRLTGDGDKKTLVAPHWSADKKRVMNDLTAYLNQNDINQGSRYKNSSEA